VVSFTNPFRLCSKAFFARMLESDNAETLGSLFNGFGVATAAVSCFSGIETGFETSVFKFSLLLLLPLIFAFGTSAIE
jgi:hypothetical protein